MLKRLNQPPSNSAMQRIDWWQGVNGLVDHQADILAGAGWALAMFDLCLLSPASGLTLSVVSGGTTAAAARWAWHKHQQRRDARYRERQLAQPQPQPARVIPPTHRARRRSHTFGAVAASLLGAGIGGGVDTVFSATTGPQPILTVEKTVKTLTEGPDFKSVGLPFKPVSVRDGVAALPCLRNCSPKPVIGPTVIAQP